ncbi:hypothetical protein N7540_001232 [Penicillium herquei]|nr:hypothetical protein N7540_001232 [Penicillium herquei]
MVDAFHSESGLVSTAARPVRKKFAKPPVKCVAKDRKCSYLPSKRGGPRKKKQRPSESPEEEPQQDDAQYLAVSGDFEESPDMFTQIDVLSLPGAGLRHLDYSQVATTMFQSYYAGDTDASNVPLELMPSPLSDTQCFVRLYSSEPEILNAYYDFIHIYFPILPPRVAPPCQDRPLQCPIHCSNPPDEPIIMHRPQSPLSLAISAVLALIPHPEDPDPSSPASILQRRIYAHKFAQLASSIIDAECDLDISSTDPGQALSSERPAVHREKLHPRTPEDLETLLSLLILSVYEYTQRGNLLKMRYRAGQALALALDKSLHDHHAEDVFSEARRRAWWMTYYCVIQGSIVSTTPPTIVINDPQFTTPYPRFSSDAEKNIDVDHLNKCLSTQQGLQFLFDRMQHLDSWTNSVLAQAEMGAITSHEPVFGYQEIITAQSIRTISKIKLSSAQIKTHRFRAFSDIPIFIKRHCDLTTANQTTPSAELTAKQPVPGPAMNSISCSCSNLDQFQRASSTEYLTPSDSSTSSDIHPYIPQYPHYPFVPGFPYSPHHSAKICFRAAMVISRMFESLPYPQPIYEGHQQGRPLPRTMPSFACCLMQSSYAMFMLFYKARVSKQMSPEGDCEISRDSNDRILEELQKGLERILGAVSNYSMAFEALDGMRDEIQGAYQTAFPRTAI